MDSIYKSNKKQPSQIKKEYSLLDEKQQQINLLNKEK